MNQVIRQGNDFVASLAMPADTEDGTYANWYARAEFRKQGNSLPSGYVDETDSITWVDAATTQTLTIHVGDTSKWPVGILEFDVLLTSPSGDTYRTETSTVQVLAGITRP